MLAELAVSLVASAPSCPSSAAAAADWRWQDELDVLNSSSWANAASPALGGPLVRAQLEQAGFAVVKGAFDLEEVVEMASSAARLAAAQPLDAQRRQQYTGSLISLGSAGVYARMLSNERVQALFASMGPPYSSAGFMNGYVISKPPRGRRLYWHQDWWGWDEAASYGSVAPMLALSERSAARLKTARRPHPCPSRPWHPRRARTAGHISPVLEPMQLTTVLAHARVAVTYLSQTRAPSAGRPGNGCLRVIPGSHRRRHPLHNRVPDAHGEEVSFGAATGPAFDVNVPGAVDLPMAMGDAVLVDVRLLHATRDNDSDERRSMITCWWCPGARGPEPWIGAPKLSEPAATDDTASVEASAASDYAPPEAWRAEFAAQVTDNPHDRGQPAWSESEAAAVRALAARYRGPLGRYHGGPAGWCSQPGAGPGFEVSAADREDPLFCKFGGQRTDIVPVVGVTTS